MNVPDQHLPDDLSWEILTSGRLELPTSRLLVVLVKQGNTNQGNQNPGNNHKETTYTVELNS